MPAGTASRLLKILSLVEMLMFRIRIRIHSTKSFRTLAVLEYHKDSLYALAFAPLLPNDNSEETPTIRAWLAASGKDERISLWEIYPVRPAVSEE